MSSDDTIRVLIVDDIPETRENLKKLLYFETDIEVVGTATNGQEAIEIAAQSKPHVVLMDINMPELDGISASAAIRKQVPYVQIIMMSVQSEADYLRRSMMAGASDFLTKPFGSDELVSSIRRVYEMGAHLRIPEAQMITRETAAAQPEQLGKLIAVFSPKGGVGCTTLLINLAAGLHQARPEAKVAVVDCRMQFGDVGIFLYLRESRSITDLAGQTDELEPEIIESAMVAHDASGLKVLLAPLKPEEAELVTTEHVRTVLSHLKRLYDYIVVDMESTLHDMELSIFDLADRVILVTAPDVPSVKDVRLFFDLVEALEYSTDKFLLALNKSDPRTGVTVKLIEGNVKRKVFAEIPYDARVLQSVNQGVPYMVMPNMDKRSPLFVQTTALVQALQQELEKEETEEPVAAPSSSRPSLGRLFN